MENSILDRLSNLIKERLIQEGYSDEMDPQLAQQLGEFVANKIKDEVKASMLSDPQMAVRLAGVRGAVAGQLDALQAHLDRTKDQWMEDAVEAAKRDAARAAATIIKEEVRKMVRDSVNISFSAKDLEEIREEMKEELKNEIRLGLMNELRAELREEGNVSLPHRPVTSSSGGKKRGRKPKGA